MTCDRIQPLLSSYHDDALSIEERARVRMHVATCPTCRAVLASYERIYTALRTVQTPAPPELRRNVYARIAEIEARRGGLTFGPTLLSLVRTAGGTAGLLAVLAALVAAVMHLNAPQTGNGPAVAQGPALNSSTAYTIAEAMVGGHGPAAGRMPAPARTAVAAMAHDKVAPSSVKVRPAGGPSARTLDFNVVRPGPSGAPGAIIHVSADVRMEKGTAIPTDVVVSSPSPVPTLPPDEGLAYMHFTTDNAFFLNRGNSASDGIEWHSFAPGTLPRVLVTPAPTAQIVTGLNASRDGTSIVYTAMSPRANLGGVFALTDRSPSPVQLLSVRDRQLPNVGADHLYVQQAYHTVAGRWLFALVDRWAASVVITSSHGGLQPLMRIGLPTFDYVLSPDQTRIAWTQRLVHGFGRLVVATLGTRPVTRTIASMAYHPVWSPDGSSILFLAKLRRTDPRGAAGLWLWSSHDHAPRPLVWGSPSGQPFISNFTWSPDGRYVAYVLTTTAGPAPRSVVWLYDTQTDTTWKTFARRWIGAIAWVHGQAFEMRGPPTGASAIGMARPARAATTRAADGATRVATPARPTTTPVPPPPAFDSTANPADVLRSFYNAINRREYRRAFDYLLAQDPEALARFADGFSDTQVDTVVRLVEAPYLVASNDHALTCVGFQMVAHRWNGTSQEYGGWYLVESTTGQNPHFSGWRIVMQRGTNVKPGELARVPTQAQCTAA